MRKSGQRGFTMGEVLLVTSLFTFASTGVMALVSKKNKANNGEQYYRQMVMDGRGTVDQIAAELRLAGMPRNPQDSSESFVNSNKVAAEAFLVANGEQIVFEADLDNNGAVERIEYRLKGEKLERSAVSKNADGSVPQSHFEIVAERVDNGGLPVFTFDGDLTGDQPVAADPRQVRVMLLLRAPVRDRKSGRARTVGFEAIAERRAAPAAEPAALEAGTPEQTPANVAGADGTAPPAEAVTREDIAILPSATPTQPMQETLEAPVYPVIDLPVGYPTDAARGADPDHTASAQFDGKFRAGGVIATTGIAAKTSCSI